MKHLRNLALSLATLCLVYVATTGILPRAGGLVYALAILGLFAGLVACVTAKEFEQKLRELQRPTFLSAILFAIRIFELCLLLWYGWWWCAAAFGFFFFVIQAVKQVATKEGK